MINDILGQISHLLSQQSIYVILSAVVAVIIYIEGEMLKKTNGRIPDSKFFHVSSIVDTLWFFISMAVVYFMELNSLALAIPAAYGIYTIAGWVYGSRLIRVNGVPDSPKDIIIPAKYIAFTQSFAIIFLSLCLFILVSPWLIFFKSD